MKITFDHNTVNQNVDRATTSYRDARAARTERAGDYALDISGKVMDNNAYGGHGKTAEEVMQDAAAIDVATQTDFMTVMSNTMSGEDFSRLQQEGYHPGDMEIEEVVTIVDTIKAALVKGGTQVTGYTDDLDAETLAQITGSEAFAQELARQFAAHDVPLTEENARAAKEAFERAVQTGKPDEGTVKYMVENRMEPTIDNLYLADHSAAADSTRQGHGYYEADNTGYYAKKAEEYNWEQLRPQIERVLEEAGLDNSGENVQRAQWLIGVGVPLTAETMEALHKIDQSGQPKTREQLLSAIAAAVSDGRKAGDANLADGRSTTERAADYVEAFGKITDEAADLVAAEEKALNLRNLTKAQEEIDRRAAQEKAAGAAALDTPAAVTQRRQLEEVRLMMTIEANRKLIDSGYSIDTTELEALVEALKKLEQEQNQRLFGESDPAAAADKAALYGEVQAKLAEIPDLPAAVLGQYVDGVQAFTLDNVHTNGLALRAAYEAAGESYEALMTAPRADLGDSIRKAFRNVDDILQDMGLETNEENRRAVRILGYNSMDISHENMDAVKKYDMELRETIRKMTPAASLQAIRDGKNPLEMSVSELNRYLDESGIDNAAKEEKFSKFLYKLDKSHAITEQEREAYIGIYRMFRQLEKTDDAAVGSLLKEGAEMTFGNLLTAMRSTKKQGMDYRVSDGFNGVDALHTGNSITDQILAGFPGLGDERPDGSAGEGQEQQTSEDAQRYYHMLAGQIADSLEPEMLADAQPEAQTTMEAFAEALRGQTADAALEQAYLQEQLQSFRGLEHVEQSVVQELIAYKQPVTANHLEAAAALRKKPGALYRKLRELEEDAGVSEGKEKAESLLENLTDRESAQEAYTEMQETFTALLEEAAEAPEDYLDLRTLQSCRKQLALAGSLAKEENYQIPVEINGELTAINLKVLHGKETGKVSITAQTEEFGEITARFSLKERTVSGYIACDSREGTDWLRGRQDALEASLAVSGADGEMTRAGNVAVLYSKEIADEDYETLSEAQTQTADLYTIAKSFITALTA
ncbi:MAG: DUF6240 domain-containing protein [Bacteroidales bacterium]|nr:DUF6240 domain-containing protein [Bacteroidales bacterium]MCM1415560.1 DUF6240 domain-containing protein [bacterium]MCM1424088.1 DUF6240 domain-containing protein [bacterium]